MFPLRSELTLIPTRLVLHGCLVLLLITATVPAQEKPTLRDFGSSLKKDVKRNRADSRSGQQNHDDVIRVDTDLVVCEVSVVNDQGNAIPGLNRSDFVVSEDGKQQEIGMFSVGDAAAVPRSIVLIVDYSISQRPYVKISLEAAKTLVDKLGPKDRMALVTDDVKLLADFTQDKELLKEKLESLRKAVLAGKVGRSLQYSALMATLNEMFSVEDIRPIIIFQTDGDELPKLRGFTFRSVEAAVEQSRATIYAIIPGSLIGLSDKEMEEKARYAMTEIFGHYPRPLDIIYAYARGRLQEHTAIAGLAELSGGWWDALNTPEQADEVYGRIFADINQRYVIGYYPTNKERDGKRRSVKVEVRGHPEYTVGGRKTYFAPTN
jgi:VWFA-related protein